VYQDKEDVFISQRMYVENIMKKFRMIGCNTMATPLDVNEKLKKEDGGKKLDATLYKSLVENMLYLTATRPYIAASLLSRFMSKSVSLCSNKKMCLDTFKALQVVE
jgi:hypothetical protein